MPLLPPRIRSLAASLRAAGASPAAPGPVLGCPSAFPELAAELAAAPLATASPFTGLPPSARRSDPPKPRWPRWGDATAGLAFVTAVALMVSLGTGVWDAPHATPSSAAVIRAAAHIAAPELPVVEGPAISPARVQPRVAPPATSSRPRTQQPAASARIARQASVTVTDTSVAGFVPLYQLAGQTFGVNWLLIASIHQQETSFSRDPSTYHGLNSAGCCGGPMQFNVTNGPVSTWSLVSDSFRYAGRPASYPHMTQTHPSIYDDFDAIMAAARLLSSNGATQYLAAGSWKAAYGYYGHDATGVTYADTVLARAIAWSQHGFCPGCAIDPALAPAVHAAYSPGGSGRVTSILSAPAANTSTAATAPPTAAPNTRPRPHSRRRPVRRSARPHRPSRHSSSRGHAPRRPRGASHGGATAPAR